MSARVLPSWKPFDKYWAIFRTQISNRFTYGGDLVSQSLTIMMFMWVFLQLWRTTYSAAGDSQGLIAGLSLRDTLWYLMMAETITMGRPRIARSISETVKDGSIAYLLNKPYNFLVYQLSVSLGDFIPNVIFNLVAAGGLVWLMVGPPPAPQGFPLVLVAIFLGWLIDFCFSVMIGLSAFVAEDVTAFEWIYSKFILLLGGVLIPLDFFPGWLRSITQALPFAYAIYGPARLSVDPTLARFGALVLGQLAWLAVLGTIVFLLFRRSVKWLNINGG